MNKTNAKIMWWWKIEEATVSTGSRILRRTSDVKVPVRDLEKMSAESAKVKEVPKSKEAAKREEDIDKARANFHVTADTLIKGGGLAVGVITLGVTINEGIKAHNEKVRSAKANEALGAERNAIEARKITLKEKKYEDEKRRERDFRLSKAQERLAKKHEDRIHVKKGTRTWEDWWHNLWKK